MSDFDMRDHDAGPHIHPSAVVAHAAQLGRGVHIGPFCTVGQDVVLGENVRLVSHVAVAGHTTIGAGTRVFPFASLGHEPQDLKFRGETSELRIGRDCVIREGVTMNPGTAAGGLLTSVGDRSVFLAQSHVAHDCRVGDEVIFSNNVMLAGHCTGWRHFAILGGGAAVHQFVRIGRHIPSWAGSPASSTTSSHTAWRSGTGLIWQGSIVVGLKRRGFSREQIHDLRRAYRLIFAAEGTLKRAGRKRCRRAEFSSAIRKCSTRSSTSSGAAVTAPCAFRVPAKRHGRVMQASPGPAHHPEPGGTARPCRIFLVAGRALRGPTRLQV